jgi:hypothetical protein
MIKGLQKRVGNLLAGRFVNKLHRRQMHVPAANKQLAINLVTSWDEQCGIATYSEFLVDELKKTG